MNWDYFFSLKESNFTHFLEVSPSRILPLEHPYFRTCLETLKEIDSGYEDRETSLYSFLDTRSVRNPYSSCRLERVAWFRRLKEDMEVRGYSPYSRFTFELKKGKVKEGKGESRPIDVVVDRGGLIYCWDGYTRLAILSYLKDDRKIRVRAHYHPQIEEAIGRAKKIYSGEYLYQPLPHPIFAGWQLKKHNQKGILGLICSRVDGAEGILDIGSCTGFYTATLAKHYKTKAYGIEKYSPRYLISNAFLKWYRKYFGDVTFLQGDFESLNFPYKVDLALCLSLLHHYLKKSPEAAISFVNEVAEKCRKYFFVEVASEEEEQMKNLKPTPDEERWLKLLGKTSFRKVTPLPSCNRRYLFELSK